MDCASLCDIHRRRLDMVRLKGLEPTRIAAREPKGAVTSVTNRDYTPA